MTVRLSQQDILDIDRAHVWHPYSSLPSTTPLYAVESASGVYIHLHGGEKLIDGMSSWWSTLHGYNHPELNHALQQQTEKMAHVMFGGFTHEPAVTLARHLVELSPERLKRVFYCDSGSVAVEVAMKMAVQFWSAKGEYRSRFLSLSRGYHGDTFAAMSVCDPNTGMHTLFADAVKKQYFAQRPECRFDGQWEPNCFSDFEAELSENADSIAAVILEPIVQGVGGMHFYHPEFLRLVRALCDHYQIPLIVDEIATGLGRTGKLFACEHAGISPDIMCLGKTLSAGYLTLAATLCSDEIASTICKADPGVFMHGPTYMGNPLACAVACKNIELLLKNQWQQQVLNIEQQLKEQLAVCADVEGVVDVRVLGAIGVIELDAAIDLAVFQPLCVAEGIWLRPFNNIIYMMPPYVINTEELEALCRACYRALLRYLRAC